MSGLAVGNLGFCSRGGAVSGACPRGCEGLAARAPWAGPGTPDMERRG